MCCIATFAVHHRGASLLHRKYWPVCVYRGLSEKNGSPRAAEMFTTAGSIASAAGGLGVASLLSRAHRSWGVLYARYGE